MCNLRHLTCTLLDCLCNLYIQVKEMNPTAYEYYRRVLRNMLSKKNKHNG